MVVSSTWACIPYLYIELNNWQGILVSEKVMILVFNMIYFQVFMSQFCRDFEDNRASGKSDLQQQIWISPTEVKKLRKCLNHPGKVSVDSEGREETLDSISVFECQLFPESFKTDN